MSSNNKVKGLLKGLRYISEIFENEKEPEMSIGMPTDVKHVAHIGLDGPSAAVNSAPTWMNEFKSAPLASNGEAREEDPVKLSSSTTDMQDRSSTRNGKEKSDKPKQPKKSSKGSSDSTTKHKKKSKDPNQASEDTKKNSRRKRSDVSSRRSMNQDFDIGSESGSLAGAGDGEDD